MNKVINNKIFKFIIIFLFLLFVSSFTTIFANDEVWNYGFIKNIHDGLIPYKDFNMVITPFYPLLMSLPMHIFGTNEIVLLICSSLVTAFALTLLDKVIEYDNYLILLFIVFPLSIAFPSYNLFIFVLLVLILYCNKNIKNNDYILGLLVGLIAITKQNVGAFFFLVLILSSIKEKKKVLKRITTFLIPILLCLLYLIINHAFYDFIDYCILGLFSFGDNNKRIDLIGIIFIIEFIILLYFIKKNPKKIENYYILAFASVILPMIDLYHTQLFNLAFLISIFLNINISKTVNKNIRLFSIVIIILSQIIIINDYQKPITYPNKLNNFEYRYISNEALEKTEEVNKYIKKNKDKKIIFLVSNAYYFKIINNMKIEKIDLINYGNSGYNGTEKNIKTINKNKDALFMIEEDDLVHKGQYDQKVLQYIVDNAEKIDSFGMYSIYKFK